MPSKMSNFKKYLQFLSFEQQISKINLSINKMRCLNNLFDVNKKYNTINELKTLSNKMIKNNKEVITFLYILFVLINSSQHYNTFNFVIM